MRVGIKPSGPNASPGAESDAVPLWRRVIESPVGPLRLEADERAVRGLWFDGEPGEHGDASDLLDRAEAELGAYFDGSRRAFDVPMKPAGTPFQMQVWAALRCIGFGATCSYKDVAMSLGRPSASRAVGAAVGANPISIMVPCHRVIGSDGSLHGFGGGLDRKAWLLRHEGSPSLWS